MRAVVRFLKLSQAEVDSIRRLHESVMSYASHGLFVREGSALADEISAEAQEGEDLLECARRVLVARGWVEDIAFAEAEVHVRGSIEAADGAGTETCHRLRGIIGRLWELTKHGKARWAEAQCASAGGRECVFRRES